jgi:hypothetical protein
MSITREQFLEKVGELLPDLNTFIMEKAEKALKSGALDLEKYEDNYLLPKIFMYAMGKEIKDQYKPYNKKDVTVGNNLSYFL